MLWGLFGNIDITELIGPVHSRLPVSRLYRRADLRSYARHPNPLNLPRRATLPPVTARVRLRPTNSLAVRGRAVLLTHNIDAKLADIAATAARSFRSWRAASARRLGSEIFVRCARRCLDGKYFLPCPCLRSVAAIGWCCIAVPSVSAALKLQRRRINTAQSYET